MKYFCVQDWTGQITLSAFAKSVFARRPFRRLMKLATADQVVASRGDLVDGHFQSRVALRLGTPEHEISSPDGPMWTSSSAAALPLSALETSSAVNLASIISVLFG
jgi:hypothetical protein